MLYFWLTVCTGAGVVMMGGVCRNCSENTFAGADDANCTGCPEGSTTNGATGSVSIDDCGK